MSLVRLSVAIANYNHAHFLKTRIPSILDQLGPQDELVLVDDGSTDESVTVINSYVSNDKRIKFFSLPENTGVVSAATRAFRESRGKYLSFLSSDDFLLDGFIEKTMKVLEQYPEVGLCCSDCAMCDHDFSDRNSDKIYTTPLISGADEICIFHPRQMMKVFNQTTFWIPGHTSIVKRDLLLQYGGLNPHLAHFCDWFLLHSISFFHGAAYLPESLSLWRQDPSSYSKRSSSKEMARLEVKIFEVLSEKKNKQLRKKFRQSGLLKLYIRKNFFRLCIAPLYWDFLVVYLFMGVKKRFKKYVNKITAFMRK